MKYLYWSIVLICFALCLVNNGHTYTVDEVFKNFQTAYKNSKNFSAEFEEITLFKTRKSVSRGQFTFGKPNLLRKEYVSRINANEITKTIVLDGSFAWSYTHVLNQVNKQKLNDAQRRELIPGIGASLENAPKNWDMKLVPDEAANQKGVHLIQLNPKPHLLNKPAEQIPGDANIKEFLEIWVKEGEWLPVQFGFVTEFEDGSRRSVITKLSKIQRDKKLPKNVFKFVIPKGAEVIDLSEK